MKFQAKYLLLMPPICSIYCYVIAWKAVKYSFNSLYKWCFEEELKDYIEVSEYIHKNYYFNLFCIFITMVCWQVFPNGPNINNVSIYNIFTYEESAIVASTIKEITELPINIKQYK